LIWKNLICKTAIVKSNEINSTTIFYISLSLTGEEGVHREAERE
jgi:hypothetical protein